MIYNNKIEILSSHAKEVLDEYCFEIYESIQRNKDLNYEKHFEIYKKLNSIFKRYDYKISFVLDGDVDNLVRKDRVDNLVRKDRVDFLVETVLENKVKFMSDYYKNMFVWLL